MLAIMGAFLIGQSTEASEASKKPAQKFSGPGSITLEVMNPRGEIPPIEVRRIVDRVKELDGKKIGLVDNTKAGAEYFLDAVEELLKKKFKRSDQTIAAEGIVAHAPKCIAVEKCDISTELRILQWWFPTQLN
jgi:hypothetical protein